MSCVYHCDNMGMECKSTFSNSDNYIVTVADEHSCKMIHNSSMHYTSVFQPSFDIFTNSCSFINIGVTYNCEAQPPTQVRRICSCTPRGKFYLRYIFLLSVRSANFIADDTFYIFYLIRLITQDNQLQNRHLGNLQNRR